MGNYLFPEIDQKTRALEKRQRVTYGAVSGFIAGTICALMLSFVNVWLYRDLPLQVDYLGFFKLWMLWGVGGSIFAGIATSSTEGWGSILLAAVLMGVAILVMNFLQGITSLFLNLVVMVGLIVPFTGMMIPVSYIFFWLARRFMHAHTSTGWERWSVFIVNGLVVIVLGLLPGLYSKFNSSAETAVYMVHGMLQEMSRTDSADALPKPLLASEGFLDHRTQPYKLTQVPSAYSTVGIDVTAHYEDGYSLRCTVILYPGKDAYMSPCKGLTP
jgi:hypothetical protein